MFLVSVHSYRLAYNEDGEVMLDAHEMRDYLVNTDSSNIAEQTVENIRNTHFPYIDDIFAKRLDVLQPLVVL